jgi:hypothetical protein
VKPVVYKRLSVAHQSCPNTRDMGVDVIRACPNFGRKISQAISCKWLLVVSVLF